MLLHPYKENNSISFIDLWEFFKMCIETPVCLERTEYQQRADDYDNKNDDNYQ